MDFSPLSQKEREELERLVQAFRQEDQDGQIDPETAALRRQAINAKHEATWRQYGEASQARKRLLEDPENYLLRSLLGIQD